MLDVTGLLESIKAEPFTEMPVRAPHTGVISFSGVREGDKVMGPCGEWKEVPGTRIATITRERNPKPVAAIDKGVIQSLNLDLEGCFVETGTEIGVLRHYLSRDEVVRIILRKSLQLFCAPERAKYYSDLILFCARCGQEGENFRLPFRNGTGWYGTVHRVAHET